MLIYQQPDKTRVLELLTLCELPTSDIEEHHLENFLASGEPGNTGGIVGLEVLGSYGLLRSLAVAPESRSSGFGQQLVARVEELARSKGLGEIYLLTTTADTFFARLGYTKIAREDVPKPVRLSSEFSSLCPDSARVMMKQL